MNSAIENPARAILQRLDQPDPVRNCGALVAEIAAGVSAAGAAADEVAQQVKWDWLACGLVTQALIVFPQEPEENEQPPERITGSVRFSDGSVAPDPAQFTSDDLAYLARRAAETHNPVLKARYYHLVYGLAKNKKRSTGLAAIDAYLASARLFANSPQRQVGMDVVIELDQAAAIALEVQDRERLHIVVADIANLLRIAPENRHNLDGEPLPVGRSLYDLANILLHVSAHKKLGDVVGDDLLELIEQIMRAMAERNAAAGMHFLNHQLYATARRSAAQRKDSERAYQLNIERIEALVKQAEAPANGSAIAGLISGKYYEEAITEYETLRGAPGTTEEQRARIDSRINDLRLSLKAAYRSARESQAYGVIPVDIHIEAVERDIILDELLAGNDLNACLDRIVSEGFLLPNVEDAQKQAEQDLNPESGHSPLYAAIPRTFVTDDMPVAHAVKDKERTDAARDRNIMVWIQINTIGILLPLLQRLQSEKGLDAHSLAAYFERWGFAHEHDIEFLRLGFQHYFANDHVSALHVLVPRYEALLRGVFEAGGTAAFRSRRTQAGSESEPLGTFLSKPEVAKALPEDLRAYIRLVLAEQRGWNLRNRIAHGLIRLQECTPLESTVVIHLLLLMTLARIETGEGSQLHGNNTVTLEEA